MDLKRIVIGVDFSPASFDAARWATQHFGHAIELILAHAITIPKPSPIARSRDGKRDLMVETLVAGATKRLRDLETSMSAERIRFDIREGDAARSLSDVVTECKADLLIVGARGERAEFDRTLGTTAQHAVRESAVPVLVVVRPDERPISHILVAVEDDATARESMRWAALLSDWFNARVTTLHVTTAGVMSQAPARAGLPPNSPQLNAKPGSNDGGRMDRWIELARMSGIEDERVMSEEVLGVPAAEIVTASERNATGIIVMGRRAARDLRRAVLGSVTATVLSNPPCSVLVVPAI